MLLLNLEFNALRSMTAFGRQQAATEWGTLAWELRSVNHRYLEISVRLPEELRSLEGEVRRIVGDGVSRGRVECSLRYRATSHGPTSLQLDFEYAAQVLDLCAQVGSKLPAVAPLSPLELLRWPGVLKELERDYKPLERASLQLLKQAVESLQQTREREGEQLKQLLCERCRALQSLTDVELGHGPSTLVSQRDKLRARALELGVEIDPQRLEQEIVLLLQKYDVDEELQRLIVHLEEVQTTLGRREPVGRRLDFLMQELNREINTLGSKTTDARTSKAVVDMKVLVEQMREQIQNIE